MGGWLRTCGKWRLVRRVPWNGWAWVRFVVLLRDYFILTRKKHVTHLFPMYHFSTPRKHQGVEKWFSDVFRGLRKDALGTNGLKCIKIKMQYQNSINVSISQYQNQSQQRQYQSQYQCQFLVILFQWFSLVSSPFL